MEALKKAVAALTKDSELSKTGESNIQWIHSVVVGGINGTEEKHSEEIELILATLLDQETDVLYELITNHKLIGLEATKQIVDIMHYIVEKGTQYAMFVEMMRRRTENGGHNKVRTTCYFMTIHFLS